MSSLICAVSGFSLINEVFDTISDTDLVTRTEDTTTYLERLKAENAIFTRYLEGMEPGFEIELAQIRRHTEAVSEAAQKIVVASKMDITAPRLNNAGVGQSRHAGLTTPKFAASSKELVRINISFRNNLAQREMCKLEAETERYKKESEKKKMQMLLRIESSSKMLEDIAQWRKNLENLVTFQSASAQAKMSWERFMTFLSDWSKRTETVLSRIRVETQHLKSRMAKANRVHDLVDAFGGAISMVDFEKIMVENARLRSQYVNLATNRYHIKSSMGKMMTTVNTHKQQLAKQEDRYNDMTSTAEKREKEFQNLLVAHEKVQREIEHEKARLRHLRHMKKNYMVPTVMAYVKIQARFDKLRSSVKAWERRIKLQQTTTNACLRELNMLARIHPDIVDPIESRVWAMAIHRQTSLALQYINRDQDRNF